MITPRLQAIIDLVNVKTIADIGTDHAYIPIRLAETGRIEKAVASDKNEGPAKIAKENIKNRGLCELISVRVGDGLDPIGEAETEGIIIAGMGGKLIADIIEENISKAKASVLYLQPMNAQYELRKRLYDMGFTIIKEELSMEGFKVYNLMEVHAGKDNNQYSEFDFHIPKSLKSHKYINALINKKKREFEKIANGKKSSENDYSDEVCYYEKLLCQVEEFRDKIAKCD